jgi:plasmid stabilization system protein ParE
MSDIRRTAQAEADLIELWLYIAQDNLGAADRLLDAIDDTCSLLAANPQLGPARPDIARIAALFPWAAISSCTAASRTASRWSGWYKGPAVWKISFPEPKTLMSHRRVFEGFSLSLLYAFTSGIHILEGSRYFPRGARCGRMGLTVAARRGPGLQSAPPARSPPSGSARPGSTFSRCSKRPTFRRSNAMGSVGRHARIPPG